MNKLEATHSRHPHEESMSFSTSKKDTESDRPDNQTDHSDARRPLRYPPHHQPASQRPDQRCHGSMSRSGHLTKMAGQQTDELIPLFFVALGFSPLKLIINIYSEFVPVNRREKLQRQLQKVNKLLFPSFVPSFPVHSNPSPTATVKLPSRAPLPESFDDGLFCTSGCQVISTR